MTENARVKENTIDEQPELLRLSKSSKSSLNKVDLSVLAKDWKLPFVAHTKLEDFSCGMIKSRHAANLSLSGNGIPGKIKSGRQIFYPTESVISFLENRTEMIND